MQSKAVSNVTDLYTALADSDAIRARWRAMRAVSATHCRRPEVEDGRSRHVRWAFRTASDRFLSRPCYYSGYRETHDKRQTPYPSLRL